MDSGFPDEHLIAQHLKAAADAANRCVEQALEEKRPSLIRYFASRVREINRLARASDPEVHARGVPLPSRLDKHQGIAHVENDDVEQDLLECLDVVGEVLRREANFKLNPFLHVRNLKACLWITEGRAAGALIYQETEGQFQWLNQIETLGEGSAPIVNESTPTLQIVGVWVATNHRQRRIAKRLALAVAEYQEVKPDQFLHTPPLTKLGRTFATSVSGDMVRVAVRHD